MTGIIKIDEINSAPRLVLEEHDPLHSHLKEVVLPLLGLEISHPNFESICLSRKQPVYLYHEKKSHMLVIGKFYGNRGKESMNRPMELLNKEYNNLLKAREIGMDKEPFRVARPLSMDEKINYLLSVEFIRGHDLDYYIQKAVYDGQYNRLLKKIKILGNFFAQLHKLSFSNRYVDSGPIFSHFNSVIESNKKTGLVTSKMGDEFRALLSGWEKNEEVWHNKMVLVHGDATPTNFILHHRDGVTAIDLERTKWSDSLYDLGLLAAELKHHFAWRILRSEAAEPFIDILLRSYSKEFENSEKAFKEITYRNRFFMALGELRIARNDWLAPGHRKWLVNEALKCLKPYR